MAAGPRGLPHMPGLPVLLSMPHFCHADPRLAAAVEGVACDPARHSVYMDVEPITGGFPFGGVP